MTVNKTFLYLLLVVGFSFSFSSKSVKGIKDGEEQVIKKLRKKQDGGNLDDRKPRRNKLSKPG